MATRRSTEWTTDVDDTLAAEPRRKGGLMRSGAGHTFRTPTSNGAMAGFDKLAAEKRAAAAAEAEAEASSSKRLKLEPQEDENGASSSGGVFKGKSSME